MEVARLSTYWENILDIVRSRVSQQTFDTWFKPLLPISIDDNTAKIQCPDRFFQDWFSEHHLSTIQQTLSVHFGKEMTCVLSIGDGKVDKKSEMYDLSAAINEPAGISTTEHEKSEQIIVNKSDYNRSRAYLNEDYTFSDFVVGSGSKMASAASIAISENLGGSYNPLFIHGGVGLGKTHLMHAIGNSIVKNTPNKRICYITAEQFMNDLIWSIQKNKTYEFRNEYRNVDVLLVDDVAFLAGKESTQEEFFHTFNALYNDNKQIVLTSDRPPSEIPTLEERLRSRFEWGLIVDIQAPDFETRTAILKKKVEQNKIYIPDDVIEYIAVNVTNNIRNLEGALIKLLAYASLTGSDINLDMASEILSSVFRTTPTRVSSISDIMRVVSNHFDVTVDGLRSKRRTQDLTLARQVAMYIAREKVGASLTKIGQSFGGRDHTTVMHACHKIDKKCKSDSLFRGTVKDIIERFE